jgi:SAM-dependent methyltransferase
VDGPKRAGQYDAYYYAHCCGAPYEREGTIWEHFRTIADRIVSDIAPRTVLDAGCAKGFLVEWLRKRGVEAWGLDVSEYAIGEVTPEIRPYCRVASVAEPLDRDYDLIVCQEVLEHIPAEDAEKALPNLCSHTTDILFSSCSTDYTEPTHINVRPPEFWAEQFARHGFVRDFDFDATFITAWAVRFRKGDRRDAGGT